MKIAPPTCPLRALGICDIQIRCLAFSEIKGCRFDLERFTKLLGHSYGHSHSHMTQYQNPSQSRDYFQSQKL